MSVFNTQSFLEATYDQGIDTRYPLHKPGDWIGSVGMGTNDVSARQAETKDGPRTIWEVWLQAENPAAQSDGFDPPARCRYSMWIDNRPDGALDFSSGKNRQLGHLLTALGFQDKEGNSQASKRWGPSMWKGMRLRYRVEHEVRKDNGELVANVAAVSALT